MTSIEPFDRNRLDSVLDPIARAHHAEVVDVEYRTEQGGWVLRVLVEKEGSSEKRASTEEAAIDLELCVGIAKDLSPALDVADLIPHRYTLEVSSPGVERVLKNESDYKRFEGQKAKLRVREPVAGQKVLLGLLGPLNEGVLAVIDGKRTFEVPLSNVERANLVFEFGSNQPVKKKR